MRISDWSSDVCSSDLDVPVWEHAAQGYAVRAPTAAFRHMQRRGRPLKALAEEGGGPRLWLRQLRVHQYVKNALVFVPPLIGNEVTRLALLQSLCAFVADRKSTRLNSSH